MNSPLLQNILGRIQYRRIEEQNIWIQKQYLQTSPSAIKDIQGFQQKLQTSPSSAMDDRTKLKSIMSKLNHNPTALHHLLKKQPISAQSVKHQQAKLKQSTSSTDIQLNNRSSSTSAKYFLETKSPPKKLTKTNSNSQNANCSLNLSKSKKKLSIISLPVGTRAKIRDIKTKCEKLKIQSEQMKLDVINSINRQRVQVERDIKCFKYSSLGKVGANLMNQNQLTSDLSSVFSVTQNYLLTQLKKITYQADLINITNEEARVNQYDLESKLEYYMQQLDDQTKPKK